jgi:hypothetical protein
MLDPVRDLMRELVVDPTVSTTAIRRDEPAPGDAQGPGSYQKFVVLVALPSERALGRVPVQRATVAARCYAATELEARALAGEVGDAVHNRGPRSGLGLIYRSFAPSYSESQKDPDTGQPFCVATLTLHAATVAVA